MTENVGEKAGRPTIGMIAVFLLIVFAVGLLADLVWQADAPDVISSSILLLPWMVGPAALAAFLVTRAWSEVEARFFVAAELAVIVSTLALWTMLALDSGHENAQSGIAILLLPLLQFPAVLAYAWGVTALAPIVRRTFSASA